MKYLLLFLISAFCLAEAGFSNLRVVATAKNDKTEIQKELTNHVAEDRLLVTTDDDFAHGVKAMAHGTVKESGDYAIYHFVGLGSLVVLCFLIAKKKEHIVIKVCCLAVSVVAIFIAFYFYTLIDVDADVLGDALKTELHDEIVWSRMFEGLTVLITGGLVFEQIKDVLVGKTEK